MGNKDSGTLKGDIIKLDGTVVDGDKITKTNFFSFLNQDLSNYSNWEMTTDEAMKFRAHVARLRMGTSAMVPLLCAGSECPIKLCPFHESKNYPLAKQCPIENNLVKAQTVGYIEQFDIDPSNMTEMSLVNKLVELDILDYRADAGLSGASDSEAGTLLKTSVFISNDGGTNMTVNIHPLLDVKEKIHRMRDRILEVLVATPREQYKKQAATKKVTSDDASKHMAEQRKLIEKMQKELEKKQKLSELKEDLEYIDADWHTDE